MDVSIDNLIEWFFKLDWLKPIEIFVWYKFFKILIQGSVILLGWKHTWYKDVVNHAIKSIESNKEAYKNALLTEIKKITPDPVENMSNATLYLICTELLKRWDHSRDFDPDEKSEFLKQVNTNDPGVPWIPESNHIIPDKYANGTYDSASRHRECPKLRMVPSIIRNLFVAVIRDDYVYMSMLMADLERLVTAGGCWAQTKDRLRNLFADELYVEPYGTQSFSEKYIQDNPKASQSLLNPILNEVNEDSNKFRSKVVNMIRELSSKPVDELDDKSLVEICKMIGYRMAGSLNNENVAPNIAALYHYTMMNDFDKTKECIDWLEKNIVSPSTKKRSVK